MLKNKIVYCDRLIDNFNYNLVFEWIENRKVQFSYFGVQNVTAIVRIIQL